MRIQFLPREPWFFEALLRLTAEVRRGAQILVDLLSTHPVQAALVDDIRDIEIACDRIALEINRRLSATFVTPIDREDIFGLSVALVKVMDAIHDASEFVPLHRIEHIRDGAADLARIILQQTEQLLLAAGHLPTLSGVTDRVREIGRLEKEADRVQQEAIGLLFDEEKDPIEVIKWKDVFDFLENAADRCDDAAGVLESIVIKQG
jgi:uncharacterized protein